MAGHNRVGRLGCFNKCTCSAAARGAIVHLLLDDYGPKVRTPQMDLMRDEFAAGSDDREKFFENFEVSNDQTSDWIPVREVADRVKKQKLAVTARAARYRVL